MKSLARAFITVVLVTGAACNKQPVKVIHTVIEEVPPFTHAAFVGRIGDGPYERSDRDGFIKKLDSLAEGMTEDEIVGLLGDPDEASTSSQKGRPEEMRLHWHLSVQYPKTLESNDESFELTCSEGVFIWGALTKGTDVRLFGKSPMTVEEYQLLLRWQEHERGREEPASK